MACLNKYLQKLTLKKGKVLIDALRIRRDLGGFSSEEDVISVTKHALGIKLMQKILNKWCRVSTYIQIAIRPTTYVHLYRDSNYGNA